MRSSDRNIRIVLGSLLILLGLLSLMNNLGFLTFDITDIFLTWQFFFIAFGIVLLLSTHNKIVGWVFVFIGFFNLYPDLWPLIFVAIGIYIILKRKKGTADYISYQKNSSGKEISSDYIDDFSLFGGGVKIHNIKNFKGGYITSIFGGSEINLLNCELAEGESILEVNAIFGGSTIIVPKNWDVYINVTSIFGGFGDKRIRDPNIEFLQGRKLIIKGAVIFGGGEIKNYK
ncbi:hypothetical protein ABRY23_06705 [Melioribacteraceae bacterium 4301-Me]|uniref:LiaF transmembrane domain-containing protein n=1 Tax=Pyranulibacter aquaticus TaxID=3163344 RepID=UPI003595956B